VEKIGFYGFSRCPSLSEVLFSADSHLSQIHAFDRGTLLYRIEIPSSVEEIWSSGFSRRRSLRIMKGFKEFLHLLFMKVMISKNVDVTSIWALEEGELECNTAISEMVPIANASQDHHFHDSLTR
jgi:hypothetical protein